MNQLPTFNGWTVDARLKEFRKVIPSGGITTLAFDTPEGDELLADFIDTGKFQTGRCN